MFNKVCFILIFFVLLSVSLDSKGLESDKLKTTPKKISNEAEVIVDWMEIVDDCESTQICVDGMLHNDGRKTAYNTKLKIDLGGTKQIKPRTSIFSKLDEPTMNPGDRQEFSVQINRKVQYKDHHGKDKIIEVGKYNFQINPVWSAQKSQKQVSKIGKLQKSKNGRNN